jgi:diadenosine tetraphosphate (Ap4A) HIT family hydrolase
MLTMAPRLMLQFGVTNGFRTLVNTGADGMQEVQHVHMHVMGGPRPWVKGFKDGVRDGTATPPSDPAAPAPRVGTERTLDPNGTVDVETKTRS